MTPMRSAQTLFDPTKLIGEREVLTSRILRERLVARGYSEANARQVIRRSFARGGSFWRSESIVLPHGEHLFARRGFLGDRQFHRLVGKILAEYRPGLARCLTLVARDGVLNRVQAHKLLASPAMAGSKAPYPGYDDDVEALKELGVRVCRAGTIFEHLVGGDWKVGKHTDELAAKSVTALRKEALLTRILVERFRQQNLISWGGAEFPTGDRTAVEFNNQIFSGYAFCYLRPARRLEEKDGKNRLVPCSALFDVHAGKCSLPHVQSFLQRAERATCRGTRRQSWLGIVAGREFEEAAWGEARSKGLVTVSFRQMFGDEALNAMSDVEEILEAFQYDADPAVGIAKVDSFTDSLRALKVNPVIVELRSIGFEVLTGLVLRSDGYESLGFGVLVPFKQTRRDVDVHAQRGREVRIVECKAYHSNKEISSSDVSKFYEETFPAFIGWWTKKFGRPPEHCVAEIWTSGKVGDEARKRLAELPLRRNVTANLFGPQEIIAPLPAVVRERCSRLLVTIALTDQPESEDSACEESADVSLWLNN
jgi:hypothetical protein